jgi:hypothetical protein
MTAIHRTGQASAAGRVAGRAPTTADEPADERGQSISVFVLVVTMAMFVTAGLVIDGGQKATVTSRAEAAAAGAARAAGNAAATGAVVGTPDTSAAVRAARGYLAGVAGVTGNVSLSDGQVVVTTRSVAQTIFLSVIGLGSVTGTGRAEARIFATGGR